MSEDKAKEYFSDGISAELLNFLAKLPQLQKQLAKIQFKVTRPPKEPK